MAGLDGLLIGLLVGAAVIILFLFVMAVVWPPIAFRRIRWRLTPIGFEIRRGVVWRAAGRCLASKLLCIAE